MLLFCFVLFFVVVVVTGPILFPYQNEVFLEFKVSFYQPDHRYHIVSSALFSL